MWKLFLLFSLLPCLGVFLCRHLFYLRPLYVINQEITQSSTPFTLSLTPSALAHKILEGNALIQTTSWKEGSIKKSGGSLSLLIPQHWDQNPSLQHLGQAAHLAGLTHHASQKQSSVFRRQEAIRFGLIVPVLVIVILIFLILSGQLSILWSVTLFIASLGLSSFNLLCTQLTDLLGAQQANRKIQSLAIPPFEKKILLRLTRASAWRRVTPRCFHFFLKVKRPS